MALVVVGCDDGQLHLIDDRGELRCKVDCWFPGSPSPQHDRGTFRAVQFSGVQRSSACDAGPRTQPRDQRGRHLVVRQDRGDSERGQVH